MDLERILHCDGIWLHALKYQGQNWSFKTDLPIWAHDNKAFKSSINVSTIADD